MSVEFGSGNACPSGYSKLTSVASCRAGLRLMGHKGESYNGEEDDESWPNGCYFCDDVKGCSDGAWLNVHSTGQPNGDAKPYCSSDFTPLEQGETLFIGDSDIDYWDESLSLITPSYNVGYGGYTCKNVRDEMSEMSGAFAPSNVVLVCGENDIGGGRGVANTLKYFNEVVDHYIASGSRVFYIGTKPEPETTSIHGLYNEYDISIAERAATLAAVANGGLPPLVMIDSYAGFVAAGNGADLYKGDGLHLSSSGYALWGSWLGTALGATGDDLNCYLWRSGVCVIFAPTPYNLDGNGAGERRRVATTIMTAFVPSLAAMMMLC
ncbi:hypothetical protein TrST_g3330 [Triparma strigata]|uniref:SGNH hydrolase-type esterase domain-containing protein n=1 Tax=Triparma strigata TaxID=1606541 RepID=A0A9W7AL28_9STRA|nr:hypothetical protein TrST_g3330 [Triparma strigata]